MSKYKDLEARVKKLEEQLEDKMQEREVLDFSRGHYYFGEYRPTKIITIPTIRAEVDEIMKHLGLEVQTTEPVHEDPKIVVTKKGKAKK